MTKAEALKKDFLSAYKSKAYNITAACTAVGIGREVYYRWLKSDPDFTQQLDFARESLIDFAESKLIQHINKDNIVALLFFLKCKAKSRGYVEKEVEVDKPSEINWSEVGKTFAEAANQIATKKPEE